MLAGRKLLVTGGSSGIGAATVRVARARGAQAQILDIKAPAAEEMANFVQADVADFAQVQAAVVEAARR